MNNLELLRLYNQFNKVHNQFTAVKRKHVFMDFSDNLYPSEIQVLCLIKEHPEYSLSDISRDLYMTKSAVSQTVKKLTSKDFLEKYRDPMNERFNILQLTTKGQSAVKLFMDKESYTFGELFKFIESRSDNDLEAIKDFLDLLETMFDKKLN